MKNKFLFLLLIFLGLPLAAQQKLPLKNTEVKSLTSLHNVTLQKDLEKEILKNPTWKNLIDKKKMSVGVVDLSNPKEAKFARINGDYMMYAASLPKIAVLLASVDAIENGELIETDEIKTDMRLMISKSNNQATTRMIDRVGYEKIESVLTDPKYEFYDEDKGGGLWVGKRYGGGGDTNQRTFKKFKSCRFSYSGLQVLLLTC